MECEIKQGYMTFTMPSETADNMVQQYLRDFALGLNDQIKELKSKKNIKDYEKKDIADSYFYRDAMIKVLEYITTDSEHKEWLKYNKLNVD